MAKAFIDDTHLTDIADAIRATLDESRQYLPSEMAAAIQSIPVMTQLLRKKYFQPVPAGAASGYATIEQIEGNTVVWNQLFNNTLSIGKWSSSGDTFTFTHTDTTYAGVCTATGNSFAYYFALTNLIPDYHKILVSVDVLTSETDSIYSIRTGRNGNNPNFSLTANQIAKIRQIYSVINGSSDTSTYIIFQRKNVAFPVGGTFSLSDLNIIDLTAIFGAGNEPTTVEEFEAWMAQNIGTLPYYDYNAGELLSVRMSGVKSVGFNQWDEEWERGGINNGLPQSNTFQIRSKNFIPILSSQDYCYTGYNYMWIYYYDADKNWIGPNADFKSNDVLYMIKMAPQNAKYIRFKYGFSDSPATTYNNDVCINFSDPAKNGTYKPYQSDSADIDVTTITGINSATNVRETIFPQGMKQADIAGTVKDELDLLSDTATVRCGRVELGSLSWGYSSNTFRTDSLTTKKEGLGNIMTTIYITGGSYSSLEDKRICGVSSTQRLYFKDSSYDGSSLVSGHASWLEGVYATYELATPITYTDLQDANGNPLNPRYKVEQGGTEQVLPVNTSTPTTVAPTLSTIYKKNN